MIWMIFAIGAVYLLSAAAARRSRTKLLARLRSEWGSARERARDFELIAGYHRSHASAECLDDRTWSDLLLDDLYAVLDRTESSVGQQLLYQRLRTAATFAQLEEFEALVVHLTDDLESREQAQMALSRLADPAGYHLHWLARTDALDRQWWHGLFPVSASAMFLSLLLAFVWPRLLVVAIVWLMVNFIIRIVTAQRVGMEIGAFRLLRPLLDAAHRLATIDNALTNALSGDLSRLRRLRAIALWASRDPVAANDWLGAIMEYVNMMFLLDVNALYFAAGELRRCAPALLHIITSVGEVDAAIAVASFRSGTSGWTRPRFQPPHAPARLSGLRHPLIADAVPNSIEVAPPRGILVTGSNMSGKSTFLRTVGVNAVLAQTINTCLASAYQAPIWNVRSCIGRADDLLAGKSYYQVEVESVLSLVAASEHHAPHLFLFDELFRGTNAVERIAAAEAVLTDLVRDGKPHVVMTATHDNELVDLLHGLYAVCHFGDAVGPEGLVFDYHLCPGPATSRNAITILRLSGAPKSLIDQALRRAATLDEQRRSYFHEGRSNPDDRT